MHVAGQPVADLPARVAQTGPVIQGKVHWLRVQHLAAVADIGHVTGRQNARHILFGDDGILQIPFPGQTIAARLGPREADDHMIDPHIRHLLRRLNGGPDRAFGFIHHRDFAKAHAPRPRCGRADHPKA